MVPKCGPSGVRPPFGSAARRGCSLCAQACGRGGRVLVPLVGVGRGRPRPLARCSRLVGGHAGSRLRLSHAAGAASAAGVSARV